MHQCTGLDSLQNARTRQSAACSSCQYTTGKAGTRGSNIQPKRCRQPDSFRSASQTDTVHPEGRGIFEAGFNAQAFCRRTRGASLSVQGSKATTSQIGVFVLTPMIPHERQLDPEVDVSREAFPAASVVQIGTRMCRC